MGFAAAQPILRANPRPALLADVRHDARSGLGDDGSDRRHQRAKNGDVVARRMNDDHRKRKTLEALLVFKIAIDGDQNIKLGCSTPQQFAVLDAGPAELSNGLDLVAGKVVAQRARDALVKQHSHRQSDGLSPVRAQLSPCRE